MNAIPMSDPAREAAKELAVSYHGYITKASAGPKTPSEWNALYLWSQMLLDDQDRVGVILVAPETLEMQRDRALRALAMLDPAEHDEPLAHVIRYARRAAA